MPLWRCPPTRNAGLPGRPADADVRCRAFSASHATPADAEGPLAARPTRQRRLPAAKGRHRSGPGCSRTQPNRAAHPAPPLPPPPAKPAPPPYQPLPPLPLLPAVMPEPPVCLRCRRCHPGMICRQNATAPAPPPAPPVKLPPWISRTELVTSSAAAPSPPEPPTPPVPPSPPLPPRYGCHRCRLPKAKPSLAPW